MKQHLVYLMLILGSLATAAGVGGCGAWGNNEKATTAGPQPLATGSFSRAWANDLKLGRDPAEDIHLAGDTVFVYTRGHDVYAIDRAGGATKYAATPNVSGGILRAPLPLGDYVVYPSGSTIDVLTSRGRPARTIELEKPIRSGAAGDGTIIYVGLGHYEGTGVVAKVDISRPYKMVLWELMTEAAVTATPAILNRIVYIGSEDGRIYAVSDERGQMWSLENGKGWFQTQGKFISDIKADEFGVYAANTDSKLYALDPQTGRIKWQYYGSGPLKTSPVVTATMVYQLVPGQGIVAIDKMQGEFVRKPRWMAKDARQVLSEDDQNVYLRRRDNRLMAVNKQTGEVLFTSKSAPLDLFATNTTDSTIYGVSRDGKVAAIRPILREGEVGHIVMDPRAEPVALGN